MLYLPVKVLADAVGVSPLTVGRWVQTGQLRGANREGRIELIEFDSLPRFVAAHPDLVVDLEALRAFTVEQVAG